jgi:hypothetical protein
MNGKKIKIKKRLEIKAPKKAAFDLNIRHCKVKLPNTKVSGRVRYGSFEANDLSGGDLKIYYSPVKINDLNTCALFLKNVTDAKIASVTNTKMSTNFSSVTILTINENVDLQNRFGELTIKKIIPNYQSFNLLLDYTDAAINLTGISKNLVYDIGVKSPKLSDKASIKFNVLDVKLKDINGNFTVKTKDDSFLIQGKYSQLSIKK